MALGSENSVVERRLRPLYDHLDNGNNKKAVQEADKVLRKQPKCSTARALKALALLRLGRENECVDVLKQIRKDLDPDDPTLQAMCICYKEMHQFDEICGLYEEATRKEPTNEEFLSHLFMAYVRTGDYNKQQSSAMMLYKAKPKNPYFFWAVMSIVMQALNSEPDIAQKVKLPLAEKMVRKFIESGKLESEAEVQIFLIILQYQGKYREVLSVLEDKLSEKLTSHQTWARFVKLEAMRKLGMWEELNRLYKTLIRQSPEQWNYYLGYMETVFVLSVEGKAEEAEASGAATEETQLDTSPQDALAFILLMLCQLIQSGDTRALRAPLLAQLELRRRCKTSGLDVDSSFPPFSHLCLEFCDHFGSKPCCFSDLRSYLQYLNPSEAQKFLEELNKRWNIQGFTDSSEPFTSEGVVAQHCAFTAFERSLDLDMSRGSSEDDKLGLRRVQELLTKYKRCVNLHEGKLSTEPRASDRFLELAAHQLLSCYCRDPENRFNLLWMAASFLEDGLRLSSHNPQFKFLLMTIYRELGAGGALHTVFELLDVRHIMFDTLSYIVTEPLLSLCHFTDSERVSDNAVKFFVAQSQDTLDYLISAYKFGSFHKIQEFMSFRRKLRDSLTLASCRSRSLSLSLMRDGYSTVEETIKALEVYDDENLNEQSSSTPNGDPGGDASSEDEHEEQPWPSFVDSRDFGTEEDTDSPAVAMTDGVIRKSYLAECALIELRCLIFKTLRAALSYTKAKQSTVPRVLPVTEGERLLRRIRRDVDCSWWHQGKSKTYRTPFLPPLLRRTAANQCPMVDAVFQLLKVLRTIAKLLKSPSKTEGVHENDIKSESSHLASAMEDLSQIFASEIEEEVERIKSLKNVSSPVLLRDVFEESAVFCELLSYHVILVCCLSDLCHTLGRQSQVKAKKKKSSVVQDIGQHIEGSEGMEVAKQGGQLVNQLKQGLSVLLMALNEVKFKDWPPEASQDNIIVKGEGDIDQISEALSLLKLKDNQVKGNACQSYEKAVEEIMSVEIRTMRIAVEGCAHGELERIYEAIAEQERFQKVNVDLLICCGDFQATRNLEDLQCMAVPPKYRELGSFYKYFNGEKLAPKLTIFVGGNHEASNYLQELPYGGWVAPNIYYLGYAGVVNVGGLRIAGISGIFKGHDYRKGHYERPPYSAQTMRSAYHYRNLEVFRLSQLTPDIDIMISHDWPRNVTQYGNWEQLCRFKPHFIQEIQTNSLGSPPLEELLHTMKPRHWFAGHLHCKFTAEVKHDDSGKSTKFLALDKCLPRRRFLDILNIDSTNSDAKPISLTYDKEWLAILKNTNHFMSTKAIDCFLPTASSETERNNFTPTADELEEIQGDLIISPEAFARTGKAYPTRTAPPSKRDCMLNRRQPDAVLNPQTTSLCQRWGLTDPFEVLGAEEYFESSLDSTAVSTPYASTPKLVRTSGESASFDLSYSSFICDTPAAVVRARSEPAVPPGTPPMGTPSRDSFAYDSPLSGLKSFVAPTLKGRPSVVEEAVEIEAGKNPKKRLSDEETVTEESPSRKKVMQYNPHVNYKKKYRDLRQKLKKQINTHEHVKLILLQLQHECVKVARDRSFLLDRLLRYEEPAQWDHEKEDDEIIMGIFGKKRKEEERRRAQEQAMSSSTMTPPPPPMASTSSARPVSPDTLPNGSAVGHLTNGSPVSISLLESPSKTRVPTSSSDFEVVIPAATASPIVSLPSTSAPAVAPVVPKMFTLPSPSPHWLSEDEDDDEEEEPHRPPSREEQLQRPPSKEEEPHKPASKDEEPNRPLSKDEELQRPPSKEEEPQRPPSKEEAETAVVGKDTVIKEGEAANAVSEENDQQMESESEEKVKKTPSLFDSQASPTAVDQEAKGDTAGATTGAESSAAGVVSPTKEGAGGTGTSTPGTDVREMVSPTEDVGDKILGAFSPTSTVGEAGKPIIEAQSPTEAVMNKMEPIIGALSPTKSVGEAGESTSRMEDSDSDDDPFAF
ncbi:unnamed protein product [Cyprideis torosa]|uniref:N-terminal acetyltransferase B complex subunit MDM20 homolog n=1 Tax=Cyprideis torosa TaxID=163714 RepID=A0A7R8WI71_9CRUS|nr:unnamed protein product [Cyprideis torosa]CAG0897551.1 unnamed protein product [Cyprideis torosa]